MIKGKPQDDICFFEANEDLTMVPEFNELISFYGQEKAGKIMWAIWYVCHPESGLFDQPREDKRRWVVMNYLDGEAIDWDSAGLMDAIKVFPRLCMSHEEQAYHDFKMLYEISMRDAMFMDANKRVTFMRSLKSLGKELQDLKNKYEESTAQATQEETSGDIKSGWASKKRSQAR